MPHRPTLMRKSKVIAYYQVTISKETNQQFSIGMGNMLETDRQSDFY